MKTVDFAALRGEIAAASRRAFNLVKAAHPTECFYAFALYSPDDATGVQPSSNSEEAYSRLVRKRESDPAWRAKVADERWRFFNCRWSPYDWEYECAGVKEFGPVYPLINGDGFGIYDEDDPLGYSKFRAGVFASMVIALGDLEREGFFGTGKVRESVTLFCSVPESFASWLENDSARRLNPESVYGAFKQQRVDLLLDDDDDSGPESVFGLYLEHFRTTPK